MEAWESVVDSLKSGGHSASISEGKWSLCMREIIDKRPIKNVWTLPTHGSHNSQEGFALPSLEVTIILHED